VIVVFDVVSVGGLFDADAVAATNVNVVRFAAVIIIIMKDLGF
jgi:hypothetical protein